MFSFIVSHDQSSLKIDGTERKSDKCIYHHSELGAHSTLLASCSIDWYLPSQFRKSYRRLSYVSLMANLNITKLKKKKKPTPMNKIVIPCYPANDIGSVVILLVSNSHRMVTSSNLFSFVDATGHVSSAQDGRTCRLLDGKILPLCWNFILLYYTYMRR